MQDIGFVHYWWRHDYQAAAAVVRAGRPTRRARPGGCARWPRRRWPQGGDRQSSRPMWEAIRAVGGIDWLAQRRGARAGAAATRSTSIDLLQRDRRSLYAARPARRRATGRRSSAPGFSAASRSIRPARPIEIQAGRPRSTSIAALAALRRFPHEPHANGAACRDRLAAARRRRPVRRRRRQLPERLHLPAAARHVDRLAGVGLPALRARARVVREHPDRQLPRARAAAAAPAGAPISVRYPIVEALTALMFAAAWWYYGPGALLASRV